MENRRISTYPELCSFFEQEEARVASARAPLCEIPPEWEELSRIFLKQKFIPYDSLNRPSSNLSTASSAQEPQIILIGYTHSASKKAVEETVLEIAREGDIILYEGRNRQLIPGTLPHPNDPWHPILIFSPSTIERLAMKGVELSQRDYKNCSKWQMSYTHAMLVYETIQRLETEKREKGKLPIFEEHELRKMNLRKGGADQSLFANLHNRDTYFARTIFAELRDHPRVIFPIGGMHVLYPLLRQELRARNISYLAMDEKQTPQARVS